ncbi:hypothetical protein [Nocardioides flavescens]|uniref:DUF3558 domain-containing protein n=1 Tax=Nocardioides flavescens TaxID=2691959 RepID=A0A6L7EYW0_9ACTN|nr:hypothetical protein [Nocardioides flavescens]MXG91326.1 hypothetical protein [Nocardioides flavescens]
MALLLGPLASGGPTPVAESAVGSVSGSPDTSGRDRTCWDGARVASVRECTTPAGAVGLATVFAELSEDVGCRATRAVVVGKVEVLTCRAEDHVVRYTRWQAGFDRFAWFDAEHATSGSRWLVDGEFAGRTWTAAVPVSAGGGQLRYRWSATYRAWPLSVEVESASARGRAAGVAEVEARAPRLVGLS